MNRTKSILASLLFLAMASLATNGRAQVKRTETGEEFLIVASVDVPKSQILVKHPTEVTTLLNLTKSTEIQDASGKVIHASDLRTGDTVWVVSSGDGPSATAIHIRKGPMTAGDLHRLYLDYPEIK